MKQYNLLKKLTEACAIPGDEGIVQSLIKDDLTPFSQKIQFDNLGSIICYKKGDPKKITVALVAHIDEVGFIVRDIDKNGFIRLHSLGGISPYQVIGSRVLIKDKYFACIYADKDPAQHISIDNLYIDAGFSNKEEVLACKIRIGDSISLRSTTEYWEDQGIIAAKALDDRVSCFIGMEVFKNLAEQQLDCNLVFMGTAQEEVGTRGSKTAVNLVKPDIAIILDVASCKDTPQFSQHTRIMKKGPCICVADKSALGNRSLIELFSTIADKHNIPYQYDILGGGGTDTGSVALHGIGIPAMALITPVRYCHTATSLVHVDDIKNVIDLLTHVIQSINEDTYKNILPIPPK